MKYVRTEVRPACGQYYVMVTMEDAAPLPSLPEHPDRILGIDLGVETFAAAAGNFGAAPFLIEGGAVKAKNQWFNKQRAALLSVLTKGKDSSHSVRTSRALRALSRKRRDFFRDFFYKCAWYICRHARKYQIEVIVIGHNQEQKQKADMGKVNNQAFMSIPFDKFRQILIHTAAKCGIPVVPQEESYTSRASLLDMDDIPVYKEDDQVKHVFSGKRIKRGLYRSNNGTTINADINGAGNILRKAYPNAFANLTLEYLYQTTVPVGYRDLYPVKPVGMKRMSKRHACGCGSKVRHDTRKEKRRQYTEIFFSIQPA